MFCPLTSETTEKFTTIWKCQNKHFEMIKAGARLFSKKKNHLNIKDKCISNESRIYLSSPLMMRSAQLQIL